MSSYRQFERVGITAGDQLSFNLLQITSAGVSETPQAQSIEHFAGGGFYGGVIVLPEAVIKTAQPDPFHQLLRDINWPQPFPSGCYETAAQLDQLTGNILHKLIPLVTEGKVITPQALGYTKLDDRLGWGQVIERMHGRGPTFLDEGQENQALHDARNQLWDIGVELGLEHAAQVHPKNPFGKPNLWVSESGQIIWLDGLPAFRHTGFVWPIFHFGFHDEARQAFASSVPTYNKIHTDRLRNFLAGKHNQVGTQNTAELEALIELYDDKRGEYEAWIEQDARPHFIGDALARGNVTPDQADKLQGSAVRYKVHRAQQLGGLGVQTIVDKVQSSALRIFWDAQAQRNLRQFLADAGYRRTKILEFTTLRGYKQAHAHGLVSDEDYEQALAFLPPKDLRFYTAMQVGYFVNSRLLDLATLPVFIGATEVVPAAEAGTAAAVFNVLLPGIVRAVATISAGRLSHRDLKRMALQSAAPIVGAYAAVPLQLKREYGEQADAIAHYTIRSLVASLSKIRYGGGWHSDREEKLWRLTHPKAKSPKHSAS